MTQNDTEAAAEKLAAEKLAQPFDKSLFQWTPTVTKKSNGQPLTYNGQTAAVCAVYVDPRATRPKERLEMYDRPSWTVAAGSEEWVAYEAADNYFALGRYAQGSGVNEDESDIYAIDDQFDRFGALLVAMMAIAPLSEWSRVAAADRDAGRAGRHRAVYADAGSAVGGMMAKMIRQGWGIDSVTVDVTDSGGVWVDVGRGGEFMIYKRIGKRSARSRRRHLERGYAMQRALLARHEEEASDDE